MVISKESIKYSLNNIKQSKARSILTVLSIFVGIATIFIFVSFGWGLYDYIDDFTSSSFADKLLIQPKGGTIPGLDDTFPLLEDDLEAVENTAGVYEATGVHMGVGEIVQGDLKKYVFVWVARSGLFAVGEGVAFISIHDICSSSMQFGPALINRLSSCSSPLFRFRVFPSSGPSTSYVLNIGFVVTT